MIFQQHQICDLQTWLAEERLSFPDKKIVLASGGVDPIHIGHIRYIQSSSAYGELIFVVNGDGFLVRKKGYCFLPADERAEIVQAIRGVKHVLIWDDGTQFVDQAIRKLRPHVVTNGGDRSSLENLAGPEIRACKKVGASLMMGVGGTTKVQSSSELVERHRNVEPVGV